MTPSFTEAACLRAYRRGRFYGCLKDKGLSVTDFTATPRRVSVAVSATARIKFIADGRLERDAEGLAADWEVPSRKGAPDIAYVRVEAEDDAGERIFLQPVIYRGPDGQLLP